MKKTFAIILIGCACLSLFSACGKAESKQSGKQDSAKKQGIAGIVEDFYQGSYNYEKTTTTVASGQESVVVCKGEVTADPYKEHQVFTASGGEDPLTKEITYEETLTGVKATITQNDGTTVTQTVMREYPEGYGCELQFAEAQDGVLDGQNVKIYKATYEMNVSEPYGLKKQIMATVEQTYYVSADDTIVMIETDKTELNRCMAMAMDMSVNGTSEEAARQQYESNTDTTKIVWKISNFKKAGS